MSTVTPTFSVNVPPSIKLSTWTPLANGDDGAFFELVEFGDMTIHVLGTFGVGGTVVFEGSNDGTNYSTLKDALGDALSFTAAGVRLVMERPWRVRPRVSAGDGATSITAVLCARRVR